MEELWQLKDEHYPTPPRENQATPARAKKKLRVRVLHMAARQLQKQPRIINEPGIV
jgi:homospermidine synthase